MSTKRERRMSQSRNPLTAIQENVPTRDVGKIEKKKAKKRDKGTGIGNSSRRALTELQNTSSGVSSLPEIPVKVTESGNLVLDDVVKKLETATQTDHHTTAVATSNKSTQTEENPEQSIDYRMVYDETPPVEYYMMLAEQRQQALIETLAENKELYAKLDEANEQLKDKKKVESEAIYFSFMYGLSKEN